MSNRTEYEVIFLECDESDKGIIENDLVKINVKDIRCRGYNEDREQYTFTCSVPASQTDLFEEILDDNFVCKYRQV